MFLTADMVLAHMVGDYIIQSHYCANEKTKRSLPAAIHAVTYALPFLFLTRSVPALAFIIVTHFVIDRWRLARHFIWFKNFLSPVHVVEDQSSHPYRRRLRSWNPPWGECKTTGFPPDTPIWLAVWLMIVVDNVFHIFLNGVALHWLT